MRRLSLVLALLAFLVLVPVASGTAAPSPARTVSAWLPYWDHARGLTAVRGSGDQFRNISPFWYRLTPQGSIEPYPGANASEVRSAIDAAGATITPTISNEFDRERVARMTGDPVARAAHVRALTDLVVANGFDGLDLDYESLFAADRAAFSRLVRDLADALHAAGATLSVAVHPKTSEPGSWDGPKAQDYAAIGAAADRVRIMAYDFHWATSAAGPIAPVSWVRDVAAFAARAIPAHKIDLGVPLYGYDWTGSTGTGVTYAEVRALIDRYRPTVRWSKQDAESWFTYRDAARVTHTVWFADRRSVEARKTVAANAGLGGVVYWRLGGEDAGIWQTTGAGASASRAVTAPSVRITAPGAEQTIAPNGTLLRYTTRGDIERAELYVDGVIRYADATGRGSFLIAPSPLAPGRHRLTVRVLDAAGTPAIATTFVRRR